MQRLDDRSRRWVAAATLLAAAYCAGFVAAPLLEQRAIGAGSWLRLAYAPACHQEPSRCLNLGSGPLAVCARCAGLYAGGVLGLLGCAVLAVRARPPLGWLLLAATPTLIDFVASQLGMASLSNWPRFLVASAPGVVAGLLLADAITDLAAHVGGAGVTERPNPLQ